MTEMNMIKAHPTRYKNVQFRSRLEAKWAAFFDLLNWRWQYEPIDLDGWTPDFSIVGHNGPIYVEVKPIEWSGDQDRMISQANVRSDLNKVRRLNTTREVLVLGTEPAFMSISDKGYTLHDRAPLFGLVDYTLFGVLVSKDYNALPGDEAERVQDVAVLWQGDDGHLDFAALRGDYRFRISGEWDGDGHLRSVYHGKVYELWREAGNLTQWKPAQ